MNDILASQFDEFLNFSDLFLLQISFRGDLVNFRPRGKEFWGWSFENRLEFNFVEHFLKPNNLNLDMFLKLIADEDFAIKNFKWKSPAGKISSPHLAFFRSSDVNETNKHILIFIKIKAASAPIKFPIRDKRYIFQAKNLPGFIHNLNGPLSAILGRIELLQLKHPNIPEFEEIVTVGYKLQSFMDNLSFKIQNEYDTNNCMVNLNRLLREEVKFLNCDLFFKHHVEKISDLSTNIPDFATNYFSISGVLSECYQFIRQFVDEQKEYVFNLRSYANGNNVGFAFEFTGEFKNHGNNGTSLPFSFDGGSLEVLKISTQSLDKNFLAKCLELNKGELSLNCQENKIKFDFKFPMPTK